MTAVGSAIAGPAFVGRLEMLYTGSRPWSQEASAMVESEIDRSGYNAGECDEAIRRLTERDPRFFPTPAAVLATLTDVRRDRGRYAEPVPALPEPTTTAREWLIGLYGDEGREITWDEHIRRWHASKNPNGCGGRFCDVCNDHPEPLR